MNVMLWVWLGVIVVTAVAELATMEVVSIWFTFGAVIPLILAATNCVGWEVQVVVFVIVSGVFIACLRGVTKKFLLRNSKEKTNTDLLIGKHLRMLEESSFEKTGSVKIGDVVWTAIDENGQILQKDCIVEVVKIQGNKLIVRKVKENFTEDEAKKSDSESE